MDKETQNPFNHCNKCGEELQVLAQTGRYLARISIFGEDFVGVCSPSCDHKGNGQEEALLGALDS